MAKVLENSYRASNIAFIHEWAQFAEVANVNLHEVLNAIKMRPTHNNIMSPGIGVGGYCLPKDPLMASWAYKNLFSNSIGLPQSEKSVQINDMMPLHCYNIIKEYFKDDLKEQNVLILGISYINDVADTRYAPQELLFDKLKNEGCDLFIHDTHVKYWEEKNIHIEPSLEKIFENNINIIILATKHSGYTNSSYLEKLLSNCNNKFILDCQSFLSQDYIKSLKNDNVVRVLGRGDI